MLAAAPARVSSSSRRGFIAVMEECLDKQMRFMREMDTMKRILRRTRIMDDSRFENDAEHSWHMAVMGAWMTEYAVGGGRRAQGREDVPDS